MPTAVYFNDQKLSQNKFSTVEDQENLTQISTETYQWRQHDLIIAGRLYEDRGHTIVASIDGLKLGDEAVTLAGHLRFERGAIDVFKRGFKLCATTIGTTIGVTGRLDCDRFTPTAGRDSLDAPTTSLLSRIALALERVAVDAVLTTPERIGQYTRIFSYILQRGSGGELCSAAPIAESVPRRLVSANFENTSRIRAFGSVRIFGHDGV